MVGQSDADACSAEAFAPEATRSSGTDKVDHNFLRNLNTGSPVHTICGAIPVP